MPERIDLDDQLAPARQSIDANWSKRTKALVGAGAGAAALVALAAGVWFFLDRQPPALPKTAQEAMAVMTSAKFERLPDERRRQYAAEARRLIGDLPEEERRAFRQDDESRDAMRAMFREMMDDAVLRYARGEDLEGMFPGRGPGRGRPGGGGGDARSRDGTNGRDGGRGGEGGRRPGGREGGRGGDPDARQARMRERLSNYFNEGNAQMGSLRGEMFKRRAAEREANNGG
ncbi:MAG: hypothetical protein AAGK04_12370 [Planctomycetota bacterium]